MTLCAFAVAALRPGPNAAPCSTQPIVGERRQATKAMEVSVRASRGPEEISNLFNLEGRVAVITGASGALGKAVCMGLAVYGANIVACRISMSSMAGPDKTPLFSSK